MAAQIYKTKYQLLHDLIFVVIASVCILEIPLFIYAPDSEMFMGYQNISLPILVLSILTLLSIKIKRVIVSDFVVSVYFPFRFFKRKVSILRGAITGASMRNEKECRLILYHNNSETSVIIPKNEYTELQKALYRIGVDVIDE